MFCWPGFMPGLFLFPENVPIMSRKWPLFVLSITALFCHNLAMEQLLKTLSESGMPDAEVQRIREYYRNDEAGLRDYVLYIRAMFDDRHEYVD